MIGRKALIKNHQFLMDGMTKEVNDHPGTEKGNPLLQFHGLLHPISIGIVYMHHPTDRIVPDPDD